MSFILKCDLAMSLFLLSPHHVTVFEDPTINFKSKYINLLISYLKNDISESAKEKNDRIL